MELTPQRIINKRKGYGEEALEAAFGDRFTQYRSQWNQVSRRELVTEFPLYLQFETTPFCNLRCVSCLHGQESLRSAYTQGCGLLDMALYRKAVDEASLYGCPSISFHNNSEPLLDKHLFERIAYAREKGFIDIILVTNGTLFTEAVAQQVLDSGVTKLTFSLDAASPEVYGLNRPGADYDAVTGAIDRFLEMKRNQGRALPITRVSFVVNSNSIAEMAAFREAWEEKVDLVDFQYLSVLKDMTEHLVPEGFHPIRDFACNAPWQQVVIRANGDVLPCCSLYGPGLVVGNLEKETLHEIWHSEGMNRLREELLGKHPPNPHCRDCAETFYTNE